ncbi:hypothetical protein CVCC1112_2399 [Paenarthrobacter nicotinovorans]|nr:hypothetical protein CVCC1112_2399 [Paenarthrobacter nicotinovorans]
MSAGPGTGTGGRDVLEQPTPYETLLGEEGCPSGLRSWS